MKKFAAVAAMALTLLSVAACGGAEPKKEAPKPAAKTETKTEAKAQAKSTGGKKILVAYYSATHNTENVAKAIASAKGADLFFIEPATPYSAKDLDYRDNSSRCVKEYNDPNRNVPLKNAKPANWKDYDTIFVGYPIWWGLAAWPVETFMKENDFTGKTVIPFATSASSGMGDSADTLKKLAGGKGNWLEGRRFGGHPSDSSVKSWLDGLKL